MGGAQTPGRNHSAYSKTAPTTSTPKGRRHRERVLLALQRQHLATDYERPAAPKEHLAAIDHPRPAARVIAANAETDAAADWSGLPQPPRNPAR